MLVKLRSLPEYPEEQVHKDVPETEQSSYLDAALVGSGTKFRTSGWKMAIALQMPNQLHPRRPGSGLASDENEWVMLSCYKLIFTIV